MALLYINFQFLLEIRYLCHRYSKSVPPFQVTVKLHYTVISVYSASNHSMNGGIFKHYISLKYNQIMQILIFHIPIISLGRLCGMNHSEKLIMVIISYTRYMRPADLPCPWWNSPVGTDYDVANFPIVNPRKLLTARVI